MNIVKLQSQLQSVPDQALIGYVQNPDGQVPSYLALAELSRRKEIRNSAAPTEAAPTQTVAEQMVGEGQGMASLPLPDDMYSEESYANGGIVSFGQGGLTEDDIAYQRALEKTYSPLELGRRVLNYGADIISSPGQLSWMRDPKTGKLVRAYEVEGFTPRSSGFDAAEAKRKQNRLSEIDALETDVITRKNLQGKPVSVGSTREGINQVVANATAPQGAIVDRMMDIPKTQQGVGSLPRGNAPAGTNVRTPSMGAPTGRAPSADMFEPMTIDSARYDALMPKEQAMRDYANEFKAELGDDPNRAAMKERLANMQAAGEKEASQAPWMALAEAGLGMAAGKSQFALQNIAEGGIRGIKSFAEARDNLRKAEERRFDLESKVAQAERDEQLKAITYGAESKRTDDASRRTIGLQKEAEAARTAEFNAEGKFKEKRFNLEYAQKDREIGLADKRIDKQIASMENQSQRNELQNRRDSLKALLQRSSDQLKTILPDPKNPEYVSALNEYNRYAKQLEDLANQSYSGWGKPQVVKQ